MSAIGGYRHWPSFEQLCDMAEKAGLQVRLPASTERTTIAGAGADWRELIRIELWPMGAAPTERPFAAAPIYDGDIDAAARDLLQRAA